MEKLTNEIRTPVRRQGASRYLQITLLSFALSITLTRFFLNLTGFPQLGSGTLHIAHVLWGGLLLFLAALLPLVFANRWALTAGSILAGVGVGLFIDEVGKFITAGNDYFYPPAAPIIYVFFLLIVLLYLQIRRRPSHNPRTAFYCVFESLQEVLDHDLDAEERSDLNDQLKIVAKESDNPNYSRLATDLLEFLAHERLNLAPVRPRLMKRLRSLVLRLEGSWFPRPRFRMILAGAGIGIGAFLLAGLFNVLLSLGASVRLERLMAGWILNSYVSSKAALGWFLVRLGLDAAAGSILIAAAILLILKRDKLALSLNVFGLLLILAGVNLLEFYFDQFSEILPATVQFCLLLATLRYRDKFLNADPGPAPGAQITSGVLLSAAVGTVAGAKSFSPDTPMPKPPAGRPPAKVRKSRTGNRRTR